MDRLRRWLLTTTALLLTAGWMPPKKRRTECFLSLIGYSPDGATITVSLTAKPAARAKIVQWHLAWGDGQTIQGTGTPPLLHQAHTYATAGDKALTLTVWDSFGGTAGATMPAKIVFRNVNAEQPGGGGDPGSDELTWTDAERYAYYCGGGYTGPGTVRMTNGSTADINAKWTAASDGDIICIPPGTYTWDEPVSQQSKNVMVLGAGRDITTINRSAVAPDGSTQSFFIAVTDPTKGAYRISGFTITGYGAPMFQPTSGSLATMVTTTGRFDHIKIARATELFGNTFDPSVCGAILVDNCEFAGWGGGNAFRASASALGEYAGIESDLYIRTPNLYGTENYALHIEDCTFVSNVNGAPIYDASGGGGRLVFRYNDATGAFLYNHYTRGRETCSRVLEVYRNTFTAASTWGLNGGDACARWEAGTGTWHNNRYVGNWSGGFGAYLHLNDRRAEGENTVFEPLHLCDGNQPWDGNYGDPSAPGWPCLGQIGMGSIDLTGTGYSTAWEALQNGITQQYDSFKMWSNGAEAACLTSDVGCTDASLFFGSPGAYVKSTAHPNGHKDVELLVNSIPSGYTEYTYPHPKQSELWNS
jgi:hypothetical protein